MSNWIRIIITALVAIAIDQASKAWILSRAEELRTANPVIGLRLIMNKSIAFSIPINGIWVYIMIIIIAGAVGTMLYRTLDWSLPINSFLAGGLIGGAIGNIIDRIRFMAVVDFIKIGWWPIFNLADVIIVTCVITLLLFSKKLYLKN